MTRSPEDVRAFFQTHWTVRKYKSHAMPPEHLDAILYAAQRAPTDATAQMYSFIRLSDPALKQEVAALCDNAHVATASEAFVACADVHRLDAVLRRRGQRLAPIPRLAVHFGIGDVALAGQNMLIAAEMMGYRGCWIGGIMNSYAQIARLLELPSGVVPYAGLTIGVPDEPAQERPRLPREQVVHENRYRRLNEAELDRGIEAMASITARGDWAATLARYFAESGSMETREKVLEEFLFESFER